MLELSPDEVLIGVDGGATEVKAYEVRLLPRDPVPALALGSASASRFYERARGFRPARMAAQLLAHDLGRVRVGGIEGAQARLWLEATVEAIRSTAEGAGRERVVLAVCMPGLKTADGRGISVMRRGPRIPDYLDRLEAMIAGSGLALARPVAQLSSDGEACAHGEELDERGSLRDVHHAYYLGGGTGLAEALKLEGRIRVLDDLRGFVQKAWQMDVPGGGNLEDLLSPRGMNAAYAAATGRKLPLDPADHPERQALGGDERAFAILRRAADAMAVLVLDRMQALRRGHAGAAGGSRSGRGRKIPANTFLDRIVVGQRLGAILADPELESVFRRPVEATLAARVIATGDGALRKHYLDGTVLRPGLLHPSLLRAAPAIGAVAIELFGRSAIAEASRESPR